MATAKRIYDGIYRWFLAPGHDWRTWLGHSLVVLFFTWLGLLVGTHEIGVAAVGYYSLRELLDQALPKLVRGQPVDLIDSYFDVFIPWVLFVLSLSIYGAV